MLVEVSARVGSEPLVALLPDQLPDAVQLVAFVVLHESVELPLIATAVGFALRSTVGAGVTGVTVTVFETVGLFPPFPVQNSV